MDLSSTPRSKFPRKKFISPATSAPYRSPLMHSLPEKRVQSSFENISDVLEMPTTPVQDKKAVQKKQICQIRQKFVSPIAATSAYQSPLAHSYRANHNIAEKRVQSSFENTSDVLEMPTTPVQDKKAVQKKQIHQVQKFVSPIATTSAYRSPLAHGHSIPERKVQLPSECLPLGKTRTSLKELKKEYKTLTRGEKRTSLKELEKEYKTLTKKIRLWKQNEETLKYFEKLHKYNEIKDVGQMVIGRLAIMEQKTIKEVYEDFGVTEND